MGEELGINALSLPYQIEFGGTFLKDSAVLAGLGVIGKHNLLVTPEFGSDLRLQGNFHGGRSRSDGPDRRFRSVHRLRHALPRSVPERGFQKTAPTTSRCASRRWIRMTPT